MSEVVSLEEIVGRCIERLLEGEPLDVVLASYPGRGAELWPLLRAAGAVADLPAAPPSPSARGLALSRMLSQVSTEARRPAPAGVIGWLGTLRARPLAFQAAALAGAVVLFAGLGIGASAATGTTPEPVRTFFRLPDDSAKSVRLSGSVVAASADTLVISTESGEQTLGLSGSTTIRRGDARITWSDLVAGERVDVSGTQREGQVTATQVTAHAAPVAGATEPGGAPALPLRTEPAADETRGPDDGQETETPNRDRTPDDGSGLGDDRTPESPDASVTPESRGGDGTPEATKSPEHEGETRTPEPTNTPGSGDDQTPGPTTTATPGGNGDH